MPTFTAFLGFFANRFFVGRKIDQLISFEKEADRMKTKEAIGELGWLEQILKSKKTEKYSLGKASQFLHKYDDYLDCMEYVVLGSELLRRVGRALSLIEEHGYHEGKKYMLKELQEKKNKSSRNPRFWENQS